jgi:hypothetical protein
VLNSDGGTGLILYRKDRVQCTTGQQYLEEHRLKPDSPTRRVIAKCCRSIKPLALPSIRKSARSTKVAISSTRHRPGSIPKP